MPKPELDLAVEVVVELRKTLWNFLSWSRGMV
jgi:hypothetical protein